MYHELMKKAVHRTGPVTFMSPTPDPKELRCVIAFRRGGVTNFFSTLSDLYHFYDMYSTRCVLRFALFRQLPTLARLPNCNSSNDSARGEICLCSSLLIAFLYCHLLPRLAHLTHCHSSAF